MSNLKIFILLSLILSAPVARADDDRAAAREHVKRGARAYDLGHYREAVTEFEQAYQLKDDPALLFNIGQAYRAAGDCSSAITAYKSFLRHLPKSERRRDIVARITELETALAAQMRAQAGPPEGTLPSHHPESAPETNPTQPPPVSVAPPPATVEPPPNSPPPASPAGDRHPGRKKLYAGIAVGVVGIAGLAAGGAFAALAHSANQEFLHPSNGVYSASAEDRRALDQRVELSLLAAGGAAVVTGAVLTALGLREVKRARLSASVGPGRASAQVSVSF